MGFSADPGHQVKCDRRSTGCMRCERLDLGCSYAADGTTQASGNSHGHDLTQAGIKRRRILRACAACRTAKSKCSGSHPCDRCQSQEQECLFGDDQGLPSGDSGIEAHESPINPQRHHGSLPSQYSPMDVSRVGSQTNDPQRYVLAHYEISLSLIS